MANKFIKLFIFTQLIHFYMAFNFGHPIGGGGGGGGGCMGWGEGAPGGGGGGGGADATSSGSLFCSSRS